MIIKSVPQTVQKIDRPLPKAYHKRAFIHRLSCGKGILDEPSCVAGQHSSAYSAWSGMLARCYSEKELLRRPRYNGCSVCDEWLVFSIYRKWYELTHRPSYVVDKDILKEGNKIYCPQYCRLVPSYINNILCDSAATRGDLPLGVFFAEHAQRYAVQLRIDRKSKHIGYFKQLKDAVAAYDLAKRKEIAKIANLSFELGEIPSEIRDSLIARRFKNI